MKVCSKCKEVKNFEDFQKEKRKKSGFSSACKCCLNEEKRKYLDKKRLQIREYNRKKYAESAERINQIRRIKSINFRKNNKDIIAAYQAKHYEKHKEKIREKARKRALTPSSKAKRNLRKSWNDPKNIYKIRARKICLAAIKSGFLKRFTYCENCKKECKPEAHHEDYAKPLEVIWLCTLCHRHKHGKLLDIQPGSNDLSQ